MQEPDPYQLSAFWGQRKESAEECAARAVGLLRCLGHLDETFVKWYRLGRSRQEALQLEMQLDVQPIAELLRRQHERSRRAGATEDSGFLLMLWNGDEDRASVGVQLQCGSYGRSARNHFGMDFPTREDKRQKVLKSDLLGGIMRCVISTMDPDWAVVASLKHFIANRGSLQKPVISWWTFLSSRLGPAPPMPPPARTIPLGPSGSLIVATDEGFDSENPRHLAAVKSVRERLKQAGFDL